MKNNTLSKTNPYLKDPKQRKALLATAVLSSSAIEGIHVRDLLDSVESDRPTTKPSRQKKTIPSAVTVHETRASYGSRK